MELFEAGETVPRGTPKEPKHVTRDQLCFLAQFAAALNQVWDDELHETPMRQREQFSFLLMGQGGSGKTAIVQQVVLPTMDFVFPLQSLFCNFYLDTANGRVMGLSNT